MFLTIYQLSKASGMYYNIPWQLSTNELC